MYDELGVLSAVALAYQRLPTDGVSRALEEIAKHVPGVASERQPIFPQAPTEIAANPAFRPMMRVVSKELEQLFSGERGRAALVVLRALGKEHRVFGERTYEHGRVEYGIDCFGPYQCIYPKQSPFQRKKPPVVTRVSFAELCFYAEDPKEIYRVTYQFLNTAASYVIGKKKAAS